MFYLNSLDIISSFLFLLSLRNFRLNLKIDFVNKTIKSFRRGHNGLLLLVLVGIDDELWFEIGVVLHYVIPHSALLPVLIHLWAKLIKLGVDVYAISNDCGRAFASVYFSLFRFTALRILLTINSGNKQLCASSFILYLPFSLPPRDYLHSCVPVWSSYSAGFALISRRFHFCIFQDH